MKRKLKLAAIRGYQDGVARRPRQSKSKGLIPIYRGHKRKRVISQVMDVLRDWRASPFEFEAFCVNGLRSSLCLQGYGWARSNLEACAVVGEALRFLGAERPTWMQGQREYIDEWQATTVCLTCGNPLVGPALAGRGLQYCSQACVELGKRARLASHGPDPEYARISRISLKLRRPTKRCEQCGDEFHARVPENRFCSKSCKAKWDIARHPVRNLVCDFCGSSYITRVRRSFFCSRVCKESTMLERRGEYRPKKLAPHVFDHFFTMPINAMPPRLTPAVFDRMFGVAA